MRHGKVTLATLVVLLGLGAKPIRAQVVDFEGLTYGLIPNGSFGFNWSNFGSFGNACSLAPLSGYCNGVVSGTNVGLNWFEQDGPAIVSSGSPFTFQSAYITSAWNSGLSVQIQGFLGASMLFNTTVNPVYANSTFYTFNWSGIDQLSFLASGGTDVSDTDSGAGPYFGIDDMRFGQGDVVPEPATMTLLATGLAGMAAARRRRKKA